MVGNQDHTINIELVEDSRRTISIVPDAPGQNCHCYANGVTIFYTEDYTEATAILNKGDELSCSIGINNSEENDYYYRYDQGEDKYYGYYTLFTITEDTTLTPQFTYKPSIEGTVTNNGYNTAKTGTLKNLHKGYYLVKLWGGPGGKGYESKAEAGRKYGYVYGVVYLNYGDIINYSLGGTGGGYSTLTNANNSIYLMIAAGGGGGFSYIYNTIQYLNGEMPTS